MKRYKFTNNESGEITVMLGENISIAIGKFLTLHNNGEIRAARHYADEGRAKAGASIVVYSGDASDRVWYTVSWMDSTEYAGNLSSDDRERYLSVPIFVGPAPKTEAAGHFEAPKPAESKVCRYCHSYPVSSGTPYCSEACRAAGINGASSPVKRDGTPAPAGDFEDLDGSAWKRMVETGSDEADVFSYERSAETSKKIVAELAKIDGTEASKYAPAAIELSSYSLPELVALRNRISTEINTRKMRARRSAQKSA